MPTAFLTRQGGRDVVRPEAAYLLDGRESQVDFEDAYRVAFENCSPVRLFPSWRGKRNYSGSYWSSKTQGHVGFESLYERTALMVLDREPTVVAISSQPMWIFWPAGFAPRSHAPDFFVRHDNGDGEIVDVRPQARIDGTATASFDATRLLCERHGFRYRIISTPDRIVDQNLRLLSRYRDHLWEPPSDRTTSLIEAQDRSLSIRSLAAALSLEQERSTALGWIYWLLWSGQLQVDFRVPLSLDTTVTISKGARS